MPAKKPEDKHLKQIHAYVKPEIHAKILEDCQKSEQTLNEFVRYIVTSYYHMEDVSTRSESNPIMEKLDKIEKELQELQEWRNEAVSNEYHGIKNGSKSETDSNVCLEENEAGKSSKPQKRKQTGSVTIGVGDVVYDELKRLYDQGMSQDDIAKMVGVKRGRIAKLFPKLQSGSEHEVTQETYNLLKTGLGLEKPIEPDDLQTPGEPL